MINTSLAHDAHQPTPREEVARMIRERTTRGMLLFNGGVIVRLEADLWAVRSQTHGGYYLVDLAGETCNCPDYEHRAQALGIACKHVYCVAIACATRRNGTAREQQRQSAIDRAQFAEAEASFALNAGELDATEYWLQVADSCRRRARRLA